MSKKFPRTFSTPLYAGEYSGDLKKKSGENKRPRTEKSPEERWALLVVQANLARASLQNKPTPPSGMCDQCGFAYPLTFMRRIEGNWIRAEMQVCLLCREVAEQGAKNVDANRTNLDGKSKVTELHEEWWRTHLTSPKSYGLLRKRRKARNKGKVKNRSSR